MNKKVLSIVKRYQADKTRLLDMLWEIQRQYDYIPHGAILTLADELNLSVNDIRETSSFYHFFHMRPAGKHRFYLSNTVIARMNGYQQVLMALEQATGATLGSMDVSGTFGVYDTACIGLSDQEPAMLIDDVVFTRLTVDKVQWIIAQLQQGYSAAEIANPQQLPTHSIAYVDQLVETHICQAGPVFFQQETDYHRLLQQCLTHDPDAVIKTVLNARLQGLGGAGFSTGEKWRLCRETASQTKYVIGNADEGEPGTYKDRALLIRSPKEVFLGMIIAAWAIGAAQGILYLRAEYIYLKQFLETELQQLREAGLLGRHILGREDFSFDIRIQMGAGAYICGDESALLESCEGKRGTPRVKPPFPAQQGYLGMPTTVNNVETLAAVTRLMEKGAAWYAGLGFATSAGSRLVSVSGDCARPGIYEVEWGLTLNQLLEQVGAVEPWAIQVSGPSGECVAVELSGERRFGYDDLVCNGSLMIFNRSRDLLDIVHQFMQFFVTESCGICTPCRVGNVELRQKIERIIAGKGCQQDLDDLLSWGEIIRRTSRCGLGATSPNPILTTLAQFNQLYQAKLIASQGTLLPSFDVKAALQGHEQARIKVMQIESEPSKEVVK
ncbi:NAD(P)H-dependent oxidoreductase subunit E [Amphritea sp. 1_MG-2023]|uniref:NAD(P)H-dependent oxidoreductase subunit E n=1 Tax=Amphritea sp. 1_MG-2023 TaxID=3062670 RepID=UPI0026E306A0|nr:NAD(P)H-dependent oxidoreductase subunit E [Amphritea sp. 1_MG-2023]MDO6563327.1 NAD(P)H-dependent oxidoreductase subunit E [Amphritea sp. 1_MG-2023]